MIKEDNFNAKQHELYKCMSDISEDCYCAGWMMGLEFAIWAALQDGDRQYGMGKMDAEQLEICRELAKDLNGWIIWIDDDTCPGLPVEEWGPHYVSMDEWLVKIAADTNFNRGVKS